VIFVALGSVTYGYCASIIATTLGQPSFIAYFELDTRPNATDLIGATNGLFQVGGLFGALSCMKSADWLGRRKALFVGSIITTVGGSLQAGSLHIGMYIVARMITGIGIGKYHTCCPEHHALLKHTHPDQDLSSHLYLSIKVRWHHRKFVAF
jgi:MFS family permease